MGSLTNRRALVTAGAQGIGHAIVEELARQRCHVAFLASEYDGFISGATLDINGAVFRH
jgi:short-subunit dehydrogenase